MMHECLYSSFAFFMISWIRPDPPHSNTVGVCTVSWTLETTPCQTHYPYIASYKMFSAFFLSYSFIHFFNVLQLCRPVLALQPYFRLLPLRWTANEEKTDGYSQTEVPFLVLWPKGLGNVSNLKTNGFPRKVQCSIKACNKQLSRS